MENLVQQASLWLQSENCRSGSILERTSFVIGCFRSYVEDNLDKIQQVTGLSGALIFERIYQTSRTIQRVLSAFLRGNQLDALKMTHDLIKSMKFDRLLPEPRFPLYKCRENKKLYHLSRDEMFHIPLDKRYLVKNQRFSLSGLPCLYLGGSSYICWEELGRIEINRGNYCGFSLQKEINLFDLKIPQEITNVHQIRRIVLALACSLAANREHDFKSEYILPQCILHSLINRSYYSHSLFCIRYYSSHLLNGDADYFECDFSSLDCLARYVNYVFPVSTSQKDGGYSDELRDYFIQTETISLLHESLVDPSHMMRACNQDAYLNSQFGLLDSCMDVKMGIKPKRQEGDMLFFQDDEQHLEEEHAN